MGRLRLNKMVLAPRAANAQLNIGNVSLKHL